MKKLSIALLLIIATLNVNSQTKFSIEAGPQYSPDLSWRIGINSEIPISSRLSFIPGLYWSNRHRVTKENSSYQNEGGTYNKSNEASFHANYITLPVRLGIRISRLNSINKLQILVGPYIAFATNGKGTVKDIVNGIETNTKYDSFGNKGMYKSRWDYGLDSEIQYTYKNRFKIGAYVESGLKKMYESDDDLGKVMDDLFKINTVNVTAGIVIGYQF